MKNKIIWILIAVLGIFSASGAVSAQTRAERQLIREAERVTGDRFTIATQTAKGARVIAVREPSRAILQAIDAGLTDLFAIARKNNYRARTDYADYTIFIARPDRLKDINGNYSPDIAVAANQYAGSVYDKGGYIYAAGMVVAFNPCAFVFAEHERNLNRISEVVRYEGEHLILYHNDRRKYQQTADHSKGGGHPILQ